jgi:hypothetical protein
VSEYYTYEIKFTDRYIKLILSVQQHLPNLLSIYPIQTKLKEIVEWYQLVNFEDNYLLVYNEIIQPLSYPQLYNSDNRKILIYGNKGSGKFYFIKALLTNILKINFEYDILIVEKDIYTYNSQIVILDTLLSKMDNCVNNLIIIIRNLSNNNQFIDKYFNLFESRIRPLWIISSSEYMEYVLPNIKFDVKVQIPVFTINGISKYINNFISEYLINSDPYYSIFSNFFNKYITEKEINLVAKLSILYGERYKYITQYTVPVVTSQNKFKYIYKLIYDNKLDLHQIRDIVKNSITTLGKYSVKNNTYQKKGNSIISTLSSNEQCNNIYYIDIPSYDSIILNNRYRKVQKFMHQETLQTLLKIEDERVLDVYLNQDMEMIFNVTLVNNLSIYLKVPLDNTLDYSKYYYSFYTSDKYCSSNMTHTQYNCFFKILKYKVENDLSILYYILNKTDAIGIKGNNNNVYFYKILKSDHQLEYNKYNINELLESNDYIHPQISRYLADIYLEKYNGNITNTYLAGLFYKIEPKVNNCTLLINYLQENRFIENKPIEIASLASRLDKNKYKILSENEKKQIISYHLRQEYIMDELLKL